MYALLSGAFEEEDAGAKRLGLICSSTCLNNRVRLGSGRALLSAAVRIDRPQQFAHLRDTTRLSDWCINASTLGWTP